MTEPIEEWKPVVGYEGIYEVSSIGRVRSLGRIHYGGRNFLKGQMLNPVTTRGYHRVALRKDGKGTNHKISRLVALAFILNIDNKPVVNHVDGCKTNDAIDNLEWATLKENTEHAYKTGLKKPLYGVKNGASKLNDETVSKAREMIAAGFSDKEIGRIFGVWRSAISQLRKGKTWKD